MKPKREPRYTMEQIKRAWDEHVASHGNSIDFARWDYSGCAKRFARYLKRQAAAETRKAKPKRGLGRSGV
jgi:hypothetical protein